MKREAERIVDLMQRAHEGDAWHGPSLSEVLERVEAKTAAIHPLKDTHSVWEITQHIEAWAAEARNRIAFGRARDLSGEEDWPAVADSSEQAWAETKSRLQTTQRDLRATVAELTDDRLDELVPGTRQTLYLLLHGLVQHDLYHAGQMALLRKAAHRQPQPQPQP